MVPGNIVVALWLNLAILFIEFENFQCAVCWGNSITQIKKFYFFLQSRLKFHMVKPSDFIAAFYHIKYKQQN